MCKFQKEVLHSIDERWRTQIQNSFRNVPLTSAAKSPAAAKSFRTETHAHRKKHSILLHSSQQFCQLYQDLLWTICVTQRWVLTWTLNYGNAVAPLCGFLFEIHTWIHHSSNLYLSLCNWDHLKVPQKNCWMLSASLHHLKSAVRCK